MRFGIREFLMGITIIGFVTPSLHLNPEFSRKIDQMKREPAGGS